jgi:hypothetical protein
VLATEKLPERLTTTSLGEHAMALERESRLDGTWMDPGPNSGGVIITGTTQAEAHLKRYKEQQAKEAESKGKP